MKSANLRIVTILFVALLIPILPFVLIGELPGEKWLESTSENAVLFFFAGTLLLSADTLLPVPSSIMGTLLGARLGLFPGALATWLGLMTGNCIGYALGRLLPERLSAEIPESPGALALFFSRSIPVLAEAITFAAGAGRIRFSVFFWAVSFGNAAYALILAASGSLLLPEEVWGWGLVIPFSLPVIGWVVWRKWHQP